MEPLKYISMSTTKDIWAKYEDMLWQHLHDQLAQEYPGAEVIHQVFDDLEFEFAEDSDLVEGYLVFRPTQSSS